MKTWRNFLAAALLAGVVYGQDTTQPESASAEVQLKQKAKELKAKKEADALLARKPILYSGFATDLEKSTNVTKMLSLRKPNDPKLDQQNVYFDPKSGRAKGFILFRVSF